MLHHVLAYVSAHSYDVVATCALIVIAVLLEWFTMGRWWRTFFRGS